MPPDEVTPAPAAPAAAPSAADPAPAPDTTPEPAAAPEVAPVAGEVPKATEDAALAEKPETEATTEPESPAVSVAEERATLEALAKKLGFGFSGDAVVTRERVHFREKVRKAQERSVAEDQARREAFAQEVSKWEPKVKRAEEFHAAWERGDVDGIAKAVGKEKWDDVLMHISNVHTNPSERRLMELEQREKERELQAQEHARILTEQRRAQEEAMAQQQLKARIAGEMKQSGDRFLSTMADDPGFVEAVFNVQRAQYHKTGNVPRPDQAVDLPGPSGVSLRNQMRAFQRLLSAGFSELEAQAAVEAVAATEPTVQASEKKPKPAPGKTGVVPRASAAEPSPPKPMSEAEFTRYAERRLREAIEEERRG